MKLQTDKINIMYLKNKSRIVKFRGKRREDKMWVFGYLIGPVLPHITCSQYDIYHEVIPETVGEFTGRFDVYKTEIFEDDKVSCKYRKGKGEFTGTIKWSNDAYEYIVESGSDWMPLASLEYVEIIGNEFE